MDRMSIGMDVSRAVGRIVPTDWTQPAVQIAGLVEASRAVRVNPSDALTIVASINGITVELSAVRAGGVHSAYAAGTVIRADDQVWVQASPGHIAIERVRDGDGREHDAGEFFLAQGIAAGHCFDLPLPPARTRAA